MMYPTTHTRLLALGFLSLTTPTSHAGGSLHILLSFRDMITFGAYVTRVNFIYQLKQRNLFLTVGDDEDMVPLVRCEGCMTRVRGVGVY